jgi:hypothetical protein
MTAWPDVRRRCLLQAGIAACGLGLTRGVSAQPLSDGTMALHLLRTGDIGGLPWVEFDLAGVASRWLIDSGSTAAVISPTLAARLRLPRQSPVRVATAGGVQTLERFTLPALPVFGGAAPNAASAIALDPKTLLGAAGGELDGVLGAPWLRDGVTTFDFARSRLQWARRAGVPSPAASVLPLRWDSGLPVLRLAIGQRKADDFLFDTGNAGALVVFERRAQALLAEAGNLPETTVRELGGSVRARYARLERLVAPAWVARQVPAALEAGASARRGGHFDRLAGSVGTALFEAGAVTLDGPGGRLVVELAGLPEPPPLPGGFGFRLQRDAGGTLMVGAVIDGGPAAGAGIGVGDLVVGIDAADARQWSAAQAWQALQGREQVQLELWRGAPPAPRVLLRRASFFPLLR